MESIDWPRVITFLTESGLTQKDIAERCDCGQSTISDLQRGDAKDPRTSTGLRLLALAHELGIPDPAWPHPGGRPLLDVAAPVKEAA